MSQQTPKCRYRSRCHINTTKCNSLASNSSVKLFEANSAYYLFKTTLDRRQVDSSIGCGSEICVKFIMSDQRKAYVYSSWKITGFHFDVKKEKTAHRIRASQRCYDIIEKKIFKMINEPDDDTPFIIMCVRRALFVRAISNMVALS